MGGFLLIRKMGSLPGRALNSAAGLGVFAKQGLRESLRIERPDLDLHLYQKTFDSSSRFVTFGGDFIASTGTLVYRHRSGLEALPRLYEDFVQGTDVEEHLLGNYCVLISRGDELTVFNDRNGYYPVYHSDGFQVISSSFLALSYTLPALTVSPQELYEYVLFGFFCTAPTLFKQILTLDHNYAWRLAPRPEAWRRAIQREGLPAGASLDGMVEAVRENLLDYFATLAGAFDGSLTCALSGGYDTRLMLAALRRLGVAVDLYVYGGEDWADVRVAKRIAEGEGLTLQHIDKRIGTPISVEAWREHVEKQFYWLDGLGGEGVSRGPSDLAARLDRAQRARLQLNGAGGEIYREIWSLPNRGLSVRRFLQSGFDTGDYRFCTSAFNKGQFFATLADKVRGILETGSSRISRREVEMLLPFLRGRLASANLAANNRLGNAILPYKEPRFVWQAFEIPMRFKYCGLFQSALIRSLDPALAGYSSNYEHNFSDPPSLKRRIRALVERNVPVAARVVLRGYKSRSTRGKVRPQLFERDYFSKVFGQRDLAIRQYLDLNRLQQPARFLRALNVEFLIGGYFAKG